MTWGQKFILYYIVPMLCIGLILWLLEIIEAGRGMPAFIVLALIGWGLVPHKILPWLAKRLGL